MTEVEGENSRSMKIKERLGVWKTLSLSQKFSLVAMLLLLVSMPIALLLVVSPKIPLIAPATPPATSPGTPTPTPFGTPTPTSNNTPTPTISPIPTFTPTPTITINTPTPTDSANTPTPTITINTPTPTGIASPTPVPEPNNPPKITSRFLRIGMVGRPYRGSASAIDRDSDQMEMNIARLAPGTELSTCSFRDNRGRTSVSCRIAGTPLEAGFYRPIIIVDDEHGVRTSKIVTQIILPSYFFFWSRR